MKFSHALTYAFLLTASVSSAATIDFAPCSDPSIQKQRSEELQGLYSADQSDYRKDVETHPDQPIDPKRLEEMAINDLNRRKRVGEIFAEGCFQTAADYSSAAMIYQHGDVPDHYFQAFLWAKQAVALGDENEKSVVAIAIDRYLVHSGQKQLFGSQAERATSSQCWCLDPIEDSFPDSMRVQYGRKPLAGALSWLKQLNGPNNCPDAYCAEVLKPTPRGTVVGFW